MSHTHEKTVRQAIEYRRSVRVFANTAIQTQSVKQCLENAVLAATSSNLQLWEFYHITDTNMLAKMTTACMDQNAAKTAQQLVVVVARRDLWKKRIQANIDFLKNLYGNKPMASYSNREKFALNYYKKIILLFI